MNKKELTLDELKQTALNILKKFDRICKENNLEYSLAYGTMLGAVRHKGFIPWDDDIDVLMKREDYEKLLKLQYEDDYYEIKSYRYSKNYYYPFSKMIDKRTELVEEWRAEKDMGVFIDIFPLDYFNLTSTGPQLERDFNYAAAKQRKYNTIAFILGHKLSHHKGVNIKYIVKLLFLILTYPFKKQIIKKADLRNANLKDGNYCAMMLQFFNKHPFISADLFKEIIYMDFENFSAPVYKCYDELLTLEYGDYMTPPPPEQQTSVHWFKAYKK